MMMDYYPYGSTLSCPKIESSFQFLKYFSFLSFFFLVEGER